VPAETHTSGESVDTDAILDLVAALVGFDPDPDAAREVRLAELELDDDLALLHLWSAVAEEFAERSLGNFDPLDSRPLTLGELLEAVRDALRGGAADREQ
jgi:hypothetical protein